MNITIIVLELVIMCLLFLALVTSMMWISPLSFISDYPPEIQQVYYTSQHKEAAKDKITVLMILKKSDCSDCISVSICLDAPYRQSELF
jgi:hypothetical protein